MWAQRAWVGRYLPADTAPGRELEAYSRFLNAAGTPSYGLSGMFHDKEGSRAHGLNERIRVKSLLDGREFLYEIVKIYANQE